MPYTGSGCGASALAIDKIRCKAVVSLWGVSVAGQVVVARSAWQADRSKVVREIQERLGFPCVIKSPCQGSSLAMAIPKTPAELQAELPDLFAFDEVVLAEQFVEGVEVTCGVLDVAPGAEPVALPVTEIRPISSPYFDYHAKYTPGATEEITPARISEAATRQVQQVAIDVHKAVGCRHLSRSDMILAGDGPVWIEVNTIPGMTETSLYPQAAAVAGVPFPQLAGMLIESALSWPQSSER
jgi:D-alanine-D-alanine ligase